jgi:hypothetical protein
MEEGKNFLHREIIMDKEYKSHFDPTRNTVGSIYRDAQINGEKGVIIGDVNHEIKKDLVKDINEAIELGSKSDEFSNKPFYVAIYEKYDLMLKCGLVRIRKITKYRPYPEQDSMVFHVYPGGSIFFCWELPHRTQMMNILMNPDFYDAEYIQMLRDWENIRLENFGFKKDDEGFWVENELYRGDKVLALPSREEKPKTLLV